MALEINEIGINVRVGDDDAQARAKKGKKDKDKDKAKRGRGACCDLDRQEIVEDCVRRVLQALRTLQER